MHHTKSQIIHFSCKPAYSKASLTLKEEKNWDVWELWFRRASVQVLCTLRSKLVVSVGLQISGHAKLCNTSLNMPPRHNMTPVQTWQVYERRGPVSHVEIAWFVFRLHNQILQYSIFHRIVFTLFLFKEVQPRWA